MDMYARALQFVVSPDRFFVTCARESIRELPNTPTKPRIGKMFTCIASASRTLKTMIRKQWYSDIRPASTKQGGEWSPAPELALPTPRPVRITWQGIFIRVCGGDYRRLFALLMVLYRRYGLRRHRAQSPRAGPVACSRDTCCGIRIIDRCGVQILLLAINGAA